MAVAEHKHHASRDQTRARAREGEEHEKYVGLRAQKPPLPGKRPGQPEPLGRAVTWLPRRLFLAKGSALALRCRQHGRYGSEEQLRGTSLS